MFNIEKSITFDAAHRLMNHKGKCRFIHGHTYTITLGLKGESLDPLDILVDFSDISKEVKRYIDKWIDHGIILNEEDTAWGNIMMEAGQKLYILDGNPTAEKLAEHFYNLFKRKFPELSYVKVKETPTSEMTMLDDLISLDNFSGATCPFKVSLEIL